MQQDRQEHQRRAERIETLIQEASAFPDSRARAITEELLQALLDLYGEGLARILELTAQAEAPGHTLIETFVRDELLASLFLLHELHPVDIETRIARALVDVRPYLKSHGGNVELIKVENGIAFLRLEGSCHGCPSSTITLKLAIEEAIYKAAPDLDGLQVEGVADPPPRKGIPVAFVPPKKRKDNTQAAEQEGVWSVVEGLHSFHEGSLKVVTVQGEPLLFALIAGTYYAYHNHCGSCNAPLDRGRLEGTTLICSSCGRQYDVCRAGRCLDNPTLFLEPVPLLVENGKVKVAMSALTRDEQPGAAMPTSIR
jgi:Fe-S cluster biogenesis protein NfuA/nitrite reductase/ring-hydroxylating ferredoxin subunit